MAEIIEMIQLSPTMEEGVLVSWLKNVGDTVSTGDLVAEIETDKATMEMESYFDGTILAILVQAGETVPVRSALAVVGEPGEDFADALAAHQAATAAAAQEAEPVPSPAALAEASVIPVAPPPAAPAPAAPAAMVRPATAAPVAAAPAVSAGGRVRSSPLARRLAAERGIPLEQVAGTGPGGRIVRRDIESWQPPVRSGSFFGPLTGVETLEPLTQLRKAVARTTSAAWQAPAFMLTRQIDMDGVMALRTELNQVLAEKETGIKLSVNDFVMRGCAIALMEVPEMNASYEGDAIRRFGSADIGMAVAIEGGLITPVLRDVQTLSLFEIAELSGEMAARARDRKLLPEEYVGATFSVSNLGMFGIDHFTAVLNPPAAGILAVGATKRIPVVDETGGLTTGLRMNVTLTCDHRVVDGAGGARFLQVFAKVMESPSRLLI